MLPKINDVANATPNRGVSFLNLILRLVYIMKKYIIGVILLGLFAYLSYVIFSSFYQTHNSVYAFDKYLWMFNENAKNDLDSIIHHGEEGENDRYYRYFYKKDVGITIFELKNQRKFKINDSLITDCILDSVRFAAYEILNSNSSPKILISSQYTHGDLESIGISSNSRIEKKLKNSNYIGLIGRINKISLSNNISKNKLLIEFDQKENYVVFITYKCSSSVFLVLFDSNAPINESIIDILKIPSRLP